MNAQRSSTMTSRTESFSKFVEKQVSGLYGPLVLVHSVHCTQELHRMKVTLLPDQQFLSQSLEVTDLLNVIIPQSSCLALNQIAYLMHKSAIICSISSRQLQDAANIAKEYSSRVEFHSVGSSFHSANVYILPTNLMS